MQGDFVFNSELIKPGDETERLKRHFPRVWFALVTPELVDAFGKIDEVAKREKKNFRWWGLASVTMAAAALILAAVEPALLHPLEEHHVVAPWVVPTVAIVAAALGLLSVLVGWAGMGISGRKRAWLLQRLIAERLRQWQWQYLLSNIPEIVSASTGGEQAVASYTAKRAEHFRDFYQSFNDHLGLRLMDQLSKDLPQARKTWMDPSFEAAAASKGRLGEVPQDEKSRDALDELLDGVRTLRWNAQRSYTAYTLGDGGFWSHPVTQERFWRGLGSSVVVCIIVLHVAVLFGVFLAIEELQSPFVYVVIVALAVIALAARVLEEGLQPEEQIARLRGYLGELDSIQDRLAQGDAPTRVDAMRVLEESAAREMVGFLCAVNSARFVL